MDHQKPEGAEASIRQSIFDVALAHHLVSPYTSLVAVEYEPIRPSHASLTTHGMKTNLPEGQNYQAIFGLPRTATNAPWHMLIGVMALMLAFWMRRHQYRIGMNPIQTTSRPLVMLMVCFLAIGLWQIGEGSWIHAKARLAQVLLRRAWSKTLAGHMQVKPSPWADTWPVGRLRVHSEGSRCDRVEWSVWPDLGLWPRVCGIQFIAGRRRHHRAHRPSAARISPSWGA